MRERRRARSCSGRSSSSTTSPASPAAVARSSRPATSERSAANCGTAARIPATAVPMVSGSAGRTSGTAAVRPSGRRGAGSYCSTTRRTSGSVAAIAVSQRASATESAACTATAPATPAARSSAPSASGSARRAGQIVAEPRDRHGVDVPQVHVRVEDPHQRPEDGAGEAAPRGEVPVREVQPEPGRSVQLQPQLLEDRDVAAAGERVHLGRRACADRRPRRRDPAGTARRPSPVPPRARGRRPAARGRARREPAVRACTRSTARSRARPGSRCCRHPRR
jgi:hypothetical protein